ncbi:hypothetical protein [Chryseobacterium defluvii]|uniref:Uncharacterized protein n=1 Tax=Chryseobacterium defluvii TaxID=160396 RepID=A0A495SLX0_9FLAO|nr:hypothetical protein [Chryseobacterium defluvii]RKT01037.1 hypothetical protein BCF58_0248 [Chryseobacterium defluvii]
MPISNNNYRTIIYKLDEVKKTFRQYKIQDDIQPTIESHFLPELLRVEKNNGYNTFSGFNNLLQLRDVSNWSLCTRQGLKPTGINHFYSTDLFIENDRLLCILYYPKEGQIIELNVFREFYPCKKSGIPERVREITQSIAHKKEI